MSAQNVNVARFARNVECDIFCDFQTLWKGMMMHALQLVKKVRAFGFFVFEPSFISYIERRGSGKKVVNLSVVEAQLFCVAQSVKSIRSILLKVREATFNRVEVTTTIKCEKRFFWT